jgi:NDP-sugar pyrophosphorylase family protein
MLSIIALVDGPTVDASQLRVVIPVGGEAKRLRPLTIEVSKAVVRIFNRPLVEFALLELARQGVRNFIFGAKGYINYRSLFDYFGDGVGFSCQYGISPRVHIKYQPHLDDVGSADSVRINMDYYRLDGPLLVVQGDNLFALDLNGMLSKMRKTNALMVVALMRAQDVEAYGIADLASDGRIRRFVEKPKKEDAPSRFANAGIYLIAPGVKQVFDEPEVREMITTKGRLDFGLDFIPYLVRSGYPVFGYHLEQEWYDVGTPRGYIETMRNVLNSGDRAKFYLGEPAPGLGNVWIQGSSVESLIRKEELVRRAIEGQIRLEGSVLIGRHCQIGDGAIIRDSCIDNFCIIGKNVTVERSAIMDRTVVGDAAYIQDSIIGRYVRVRSSAEVPTWVVGLSVIGDDVTIGRGRMLAAMKVDPHRVIPDEEDAAAKATQTPSSALLTAGRVANPSAHGNQDPEDAALR